ncbi:hypothetical protein WJX79_008201 [Trebouxia sp. C0005]
MAFRASSSRINIQRQSSLREDNDDPALLGPLHVQRRRPGSQRIKRSGSSGRFERKGHYEACGTVKLLLAFPQADIVKPLEQAFLAEGYDVVLVHEASEAIAAMKGNSHPDLILLSYRLPGLAGSQVVRAIRQSHADLPIFALSQTADNAASAIKGDLYGGAVQDWMKLPADASEVIARVEGALRHQYQVIKKLRNEVLALKGDIDTLQRLQQENHQPERLVSQQSM